MQNVALSYTCNNSFKEPLGGFLGDSLAADKKLSGSFNLNPELDLSNSGSLFALSPSSFSQVYSLNPYQERRSYTQYDTKKIKTYNKTRFSRSTQTLAEQYPDLKLSELAYILAPFAKDILTPELADTYTHFCSITFDNALYYIIAYKLLSEKLSDIALNYVIFTCVEQIDHDKSAKEYNKRHNIDAAPTKKKTPKKYFYHFHALLNLKPGIDLAKYGFIQRHSTKNPNPEYIWNLTYCCLINNKLKSTTTHCSIHFQQINKSDQNWFTNICRYITNDKNISVNPVVVGFENVPCIKHTSSGLEYPSSFKKIKYEKRTSQLRALFHNLTPKQADILFSNSAFTSTLLDQATNLLAIYISGVLSNNTHLLNNFNQLEKLPSFLKSSSYLDKDYIHILTQLDKRLLSTHSSLCSQISQKIDSLNTLVHGYVFGTKTCPSARLFSDLTLDHSELTPKRKKYLTNKTLSDIRLYNDCGRYMSKYSKLSSFAKQLDELESFESAFDFSSLPELYYHTQLVKYSLLFDFLRSYFDTLLVPRTKSKAELSFILSQSNLSTLLNKLTDEFNSFISTYKSEIKRLFIDSSHKTTLKDDIYFHYYINSDYHFQACLSAYTDKPTFLHLNQKGTLSVKDSIKLDDYSIHPDCIPPIQNIYDRLKKNRFTYTRYFSQTGLTLSDIAQNPRYFVRCLFHKLVLRFSQTSIYRYRETNSEKNRSNALNSILCSHSHSRATETPSKPKNYSLNILNRLLSHRLSERKPGPDTHISKKLTSAHSQSTLTGFSQTDQISHYSSKKPNQSYKRILCLKLIKFVDFRCITGLSFYTSSYIDSS